MYLKANLILCILFVLCIFNIYENIDNQNHRYVINNKLYNNKYNKIEYIGYIEIKRLNIKREIVRGINDDNLVSHVTLNDNCDDLNCNNIILAGHAIKNIFLNLKYIKLKDKIDLVSYDKKMTYEVTSIDVVNKDDVSVIDNSNLILITCKDFSNRIIVKAKKIKP